MRRASSFFLRLCPPDDISSAADDAVALLKQYAAMAEGLGELRLCTYNLHVLLRGKNDMYNHSV
jgi:hypothetical protein